MQHGHNPLTFQIYVVCLELWNNSSAFHLSSQKGKFSWKTKAEEAFIALKKAMTCTPTLAMQTSMIRYSFTIETSDGTRVVITQNGKPVAFMS